jgi:hypothetical protein
MPLVRFFVFGGEEQIGGGRDAMGWRRGLVGGILLLTIMGAGTTNTPITIVVEGMPLEVTEGEVEPYLNRDGRAMAPLRQLLVALGIGSGEDPIVWSTDGVATFYKGDVRFTVVAGSSVLMVGELPIEMGSQAELVEGIMYVPLRSVGEAIGAGVDWEEVTLTVRVTRDNRTNLTHFGVGVRSGVLLPVFLESEGVRLEVTGIHVWRYESEEAGMVMEQNQFRANGRMPEYLVEFQTTVHNVGRSEGVMDVGEGTTRFRFSLNRFEGYVPSLGGAFRGDGGRLLLGENREQKFYVLVYQRGLDGVRVSHHGQRMILAL